MERGLHRLQRVVDRQEGLDVRLGQVQRQGRKAYAPRIRIRLLLAAVVGVGAAVAAALVILWPEDASPSADPAVFMTGLLRQIARNDYGQAWTTLHPSHQRIVTRAEYVRCEARSPIPGRLDSVKVLEVSDKEIRLAGTPETVAGKALRMRLTFSGLAEPLVVMHTGHAVAVGDRWTWILPQARLTEYEAGRCP